MCLRPVISDLGWFSPDTASARLAMFLARSPVRSRSPAIFSTVMMWRRSLAMGWRRAIIRMVCSCSSRSSWSMARSLATALSASLGSRFSSESKACASSRSARPPICAIFLSSRSSSWSNDLTMCSFMALPDASCSRRGRSQRGNSLRAARDGRVHWSSAPPYVPHRRLHVTHGSNAEYRQIGNCTDLIALCSTRHVAAPAARRQKSSPRQPWR